MSIHEFAGYSIVRDVIGGGMANLYVALDGSHKRVVIRALKSEYVRDRRIHKSFLEGADILSRMNHPNVIRLLKTGKEGKTPYMLLEYIEGRNMRELILHRDELLAKHPLPLLRQMAAALYYVHNQGYLHLDFKPENLLVRDDGRLVLIDFDLALRRKNKPVKLRQMPGTPAYVAPEALSQRLVDERADIFSFGVTSYEMLSYHKPFESSTIDNMRAAQVDLNVVPAPFEQYEAVVPARLKAIVFKCLAKHIEQRYPSMSLVMKDLESLV